MGERGQDTSRAKRRHRATPHRPHCRTASLLERHRADDKLTHTVSQLRRSTLHRKPSGKKKKKRKKQNQERLYHKMMTIKRGFWCLCVSALLAGAVCQESRRNLMDKLRLHVEARPGEYADCWPAQLEA